MAMADMWNTTNHISKGVVIDWNVQDFKKVIALADSSLTSPQYTFTIEKQYVKLDNQRTGLQFSVPPTVQVPVSCKPDKEAVPPGHVAISCKLRVNLEKLQNQIKLRLSVEEIQPRVLTKMNLTVHLLDKAGRVKAIQESDITTLSGYYSVFVEFVSDKVKQLLADGDLKLRCELTMYSDVMHTPVRNRPNFNHQLQPVGTRMNTLRETACLTDFQLVVKGKEFNVHKVVLAAQSAYYMRMFQTDMKERREGRVVIDNITPEVVEEMLTYMYTGASSRLGEMKSELLEVADKYEINDLKSLCEEAHCNELVLENAIDTFLLAETHNAVQLKAVCLGLIKDNICRLKETNEWERLKSSPHFQDLHAQLLEAELMPPSKKAKLTS